MTINGYKIFDQIGRPHYTLVDQLSILLYRDLTLDVTLVDQCLNTIWPAAQPVDLLTSLNTSPDKSQKPFTKSEDFVKFA